MPDRSVTTPPTGTAPRLPVRNTSCSSYPGSPRHHSTPATTRSPQLVRAVRRCYDLGARHRAAGDPVTAADLRTSMADTAEALAAAQRDENGSLR
ncbi:hypothetical protein ACFXDE_01985 [Kitasatospora sp. NPDC059408]|uniref:hypothetical protein n=1 Tax=Kitasatospora sp. NPDC059408 TaxID=3346823 RepID=UPI0036C5A3EF